MRGLHFKTMIIGLASAALVMGCGDSDATDPGTGSGTATAGDVTGTGGDGGTGGEDATTTGEEDATTTGEEDATTTGEEDATTTGEEDATTTTGDDGGGTGDDGGGTGGPSCQGYCDTVATNCTGDNDPYANTPYSCLEYCQTYAEWPLGMAGDTEGNTVGCRTYHAGVPATQDPITHCPHAGPSGGNVCGTWCENYCQLIQKSCTGSSTVFNTMDDCMAACADYPANGASGDTSGDTVQCRIYHAGVAGEDALAPTTHCPHASPDGGGVCVAPYDFRKDAPGDYVRVDRVGMPAVATALTTDKNAYNDGSPADDAALTFAGDILANLAGLHAALDDDLTGLDLTPCEGMAAEGLPGCVTQEVAPGLMVVGLVVPDTLTIDPASPAGFPNGRRLPDPVIDVTLSVILLDLTSADGCGGGPCTPTTLVGVNPTINDYGLDGEFPDTFPYLNPPFTAE